MSGKPSRYGEVFQLKNGQVLLPVQGVVVADTLSVDRPLELMIYSNHLEDWEKKKPKFVIPFAPTPIGDNTFQVDFRTVVDIRPGLYYIVIGQKKATGGHHFLWIGKFTVREK